MSDLSSKLSIYLRSSGASLLATVASKASAFGSVWLLNRVLVKEAYGNYEFAFTIVSLLLLMGSGGLNHAVMYRLSRLDAPPEELDGHDFTGAALGWSLVVSFLFCVGVFIGSPYIEALAGNEDLAFWVSLLSFLIPIGVAREIYKSWFKARQRIPEAILMGKMFPALGKVGFLGAVWLVWRTPQGIVTAVLFSELIPLLIWYSRTPVNPLNLRGQLSSWDVWYSLKMAMTQGITQTTRKMDVIMVGFLASSIATAEYAVASKFAMLISLIHNVLNKILKPRIGRFLSQKDWKSLEREYDQARSVSLIVALISAGTLAVLGEWVLGLFGGYESSYPLLLILAGANLLNVSFGMCGGYLGIAGYAGYTFSIGILNLTLNLGANFLLIPEFGAEGAAFATALSMLVGNVIVAISVSRLDGWTLYPFGIVIFTISALGVLGLAAGGMLQPLASGVLIFGVAGLFFFYKYDRLEPVVRNLSPSVSEEVLKR